MTSKIASPEKRSFFTRLSQATAHWAGKPQTFFVALAIIVVWALSGPVVGFNDTWQLVINTSTTIVTFLMVFIIQNSQNRDTAAMQIKLDELHRPRSKAPARSCSTSRNSTRSKLEEMRAEFEELARKARALREKRASD
jgi:low affinity Fe/Cu permease